MKFNFPELPSMAIGRTKGSPRPETEKAQGFQVHYPSKVTVVGPAEDKRVG